MPKKVGIRRLNGGNETKTHKISALLPFYSQTGFWGVPLRKEVKSIPVTRKLGGPRLTNLGKSRLAS